MSESPESPEPAVDDGGGQRRVLAIVLGAVAAAALGVAAFSPHWLGNAAIGDDTTITMGLRATETCSGGGVICVSASIAQVAEQANSTAAFPTFGWITFVACLIGCGGLVISVALGLARRAPQWPMAPTTLAFLAIALALITGCVFCAIKPGEGGFIGVGWGFYVFGLGVIAGLPASHLLARVLRPPDPDLMADAMNPDDF
jgi:hypothetical protein